MKHPIILFCFIVSIYGCKSPEVVPANTNSTPLATVTLPVLKSVTTNSADIKLNSVVLTGEVSDEGGSPVSDRGFYWSETNTVPTEKDNKVQVGSGKGIFNHTLEGLKTNTKYYYKSYSTNAKGTISSDVQTVKTKSVLLTKKWDNTLQSEVETLGSKGSIETTDNGNITILERITYPLMPTSISYHVIIKTNSLGTLIWEKKITIDKVKNLQVLDIVNTPDGGFLVLCYSYDIKNYLLKYNSNGDKLWEKPLSSSLSAPSFEKIHAANDGGYLLLGNTTGTIDNDLVFKKIDDNGDNIWEKTYGGSSGEKGFSISSINKNGYIIAALTSSGISKNKTSASIGSTDYWILYVDNLGVQIWDKTYGGKEYDYPQKVICDNENNIYVVGNSIASLNEGTSKSAPGYTFGDYDYWIIKLDFKGNKIWDKVLGGESRDLANDIILNQDNDILIAGTSRSDKSDTKSPNPEGIQRENYWLVQLDKKGNIVWEQSIGGKNDDTEPSFLKRTNITNEIKIGGISNSPKSIYKSQDPLNWTGIGKQKEFWLLNLTISVVD